MNEENIISQRREWRRFIFFCTNLIISLAVTLLMADLFWRIGYSTLYIFILILFFILTWQISQGITHSIFGFFSFPKKNSFTHITETIKYQKENIPLANTAILIPIYNEDTQRVYEGIRTIYLSLKESKTLEFYDFFILSDSTNLNRWILEESLWVNLCQQLSAFGRIYYRRRSNNFHKKAGNVADFCKNWGSRYRYMICLDADSIMSGDTITALTKIMEKNPKVGICQTAPKIVNGTTLFSRMLQFCSHFYGPLFQSGLNFWQQSKGNYWGHNAIIRISAFMEHCALPRLPGKEPFGGKILSHDFVEAALIQKAGWEVWMAHNLDGSYEETPHNLIEFAIRDRRWCQGNLQHTWVLMSKGLPWSNKVHFFNGIMAYLSSFLWFIFLVLSTIAVYQTHEEDLSLIIVSSFAGFIHLTIEEEYILIFSITMGIIFLPKFLSFFRYLIFFRQEFKNFGGVLKSFVSVILEIILSAIMAPIMMLFHTKFIIYIIIGKSVNWNTQNRDAEDGIKVRAAIATHLSHTIIGIIWAIIAFHYSQSLFWWMTPITFSLILSIPISVIFSKTSIGNKLKEKSIFLTTPEKSIPSEIQTLDTCLMLNEIGFKNNLFENPYYGITYCIVDPYINAVHITMLYERMKTSIEELAKENKVADTLLKKGPSSLTPIQIKKILYDPVTLKWLHQQVWLRPSSELHPSWQEAIVSLQ